MGIKTDKTEDIHFRVTPGLFAEYRSMCAELGRIGNNMNWIARHLNSGGSDNTVIRWFDNNCWELDDIIMLLKMMYEKKLAS